MRRNIYISSSLNPRPGAGGGGCLYPAGIETLMRSYPAMTAPVAEETATSTAMLSFLPCPHLPEAGMGIKAAGGRRGAGGILRTLAESPVRAIPSAQR